MGEENSLTLFHSLSVWQLLWAEGAAWATGWLELSEQAPGCELEPADQSWHSSGPQEMSAGSAPWCVDLTIALSTASKEYCEFFVQTPQRLRLEAKLVSMDWQRFPTCLSAGRTAG
eukprot:6346499-Amphidinium_carterae.2